MFRFLGRWALRIALVTLVLAVFGNGGMLAQLAGWAVLAYLVWCGLPRLTRHLGALWRLTSLRRHRLGGRVFVGRLRGDTL